MTDHDAFLSLNMSSMNVMQEQHVSTKTSDDQHRNLSSSLSPPEPHSLLSLRIFASISAYQHIIVLSSLLRVRLISSCLKLSRIWLWKCNITFCTEYECNLRQKRMENTTLSLLSFWILYETLQNFLLYNNITNSLKSSQFREAGRSST